MTVLKLSVSHRLKNELFLQNFEKYSTGDEFLYSEIYLLFFLPSFFYA